MQVVNYAMEGLGEPGQIPLGFLEVLKDMHPKRMREVYYGQARSWDKQLHHNIPYFASESRQFEPPKNETRLERYQRWLEIPLQRDVTLAYKTQGEPAFYPIIGFIPYIIPTMIGIVLELPPVLTMYLASICNSLACIYLGYWMIRAIPVMKWGYVFLLTVPSLFLIRLVVMPDAICLELCMLMLAVILNLLLRPSALSYKQQALYILLAIMVGMVKVAYFPITLLTALIPRRCFYSRWNQWLFVAAALAASTMASVLWAMYIKDVNDYTSLQYFWSGKGWGGTHNAIMSPLHTVYLALQEFFSLGEQEERLRNMYFWPVWLELRVPMSIMWLFTLAILLTVVLPAGDDVWRPSKQQRLIFLLTFIAIYMTIYIAKIMTTPIGTGLQGRYFAPAYPLLLGAFYNPFKIQPKKQGVAVLRALRASTRWLGHGFVLIGLIIWVEMHGIMFRILHII